MLEIRKSNISGRGVFATENIPKGTELCCDVILIYKKEKHKLRHTGIDKYYFPWDRDHSSICFGFGSFLNHAEIPNLEVNRIDKINLKKYFITLKDISKNEELFINYVGDSRIVINFNE